jgi:hypothetical protein
MEPRNELMKKTVKQNKDKAKKRRFQIVKLEERIAPRIEHYGNNPGNHFGQYKH